MKRKQSKVPKPRNPFAMHAALRSGAGLHDKPYKVKRAAEKAAMKKRVRDGFDPDMRLIA